MSNTEQTSILNPTTTNENTASNATIVEQNTIELDAIDPCLLTPMERELQQHAIGVRQRMEKTHNKRHLIKKFSIGELVALKVPRDDLASLDNTRIICRILKEPYPSTYQLLYIHGILERHYPAAELNSISSLAGNPLEIIPSKSNIIILRAAAALDSQSTTIAVLCGCGGQCKTRQCSCVRYGVKCSIYCHSFPDHECDNLAPPELRYVRPLRP